MANTIQVSINVADQVTKDLLVAALTASGFDAFEETDNQLLAFIPEENYNSETIVDLITAHNLAFTSNLIQEQNWNAVWESNFHPVVIGSFCAIRAHFHQAFTNVVHEIVITPKMSFGTGHHATTFMMVSEMSKLDFTNKTVADFGTGTGVLAILADKMNAASVWAIDYDDWSIENASENIERNNCKSIHLEKADAFKTEQKFDIILANINRNVILDNVDGLLASMKTGSQLLLSGLLTSDENDIISAFRAYGLKHLSTVERNNWICILLGYGNNV